MKLESVFSGYHDRRMFRIFLIGMVSGFPWVLIGSALTLWLREDGLSRTTVGFASLIFSVYAINFLWAPLIDKIRIPFLSDRLGARKAWIMTFQAVIMLAVFGWSLLDASANLTAVIALGLVIAIASASQDITLDALRIEQVRVDETDRMAAGAAMTVIGWWTGFKLGGLALLAVADYFENTGNPEYWQASFLVIIGIMMVMNIGIFFIPEQPAARASAPQKAISFSLESGIAWLVDTVVSPLAAFFKNNGVKLGLAILAFIFLFKIGEAFMGKMSILFYKEIGFSKTDIGIFSKGLGWITTITFTLIGGFIAMRFGTVKALFYAGIAMASTNLMFTLLAWSGKSTLLFAIAVVLDDLTAAFATVVFVTFISLMVDRRYTATQYALLASIGTAGRTVFAALSGLMVDSLSSNWGLFFIITALMVIPSLVLLKKLEPYLMLKKE